MVVSKAPGCRGATEYRLQQRTQVSSREASRIRIADRTLTRRWQRGRVVMESGGFRSVPVAAVADDSAPQARLSAVPGT